MASGTSTFDVAIIGCGIAGLNAAVSAARDGARVAVLERARQEERGGNSRYSGANMLMKSCDDVADDFIDRLRESAAGGVAARLPTIWNPGSTFGSDPIPEQGEMDEVISTFSQEAPATLRELERLGVRFVHNAPLHGFGASYLGPDGGGLAIVDALAEEAGRWPKVSFLYETTATGLILNEDGALEGLRLRDAAGTSKSLRAASVVLASGGFEGNQEMLVRYLGRRASYLRPFAKGGYYNRGEGIEMALAIGAAPAGEYSNYHATPIDPRSDRRSALYGFIYGILVTQQGVRFVDEACGAVDFPPTSRTFNSPLQYEPVTRLIPDQPGGIAYIVVDSKIEDLPNRGGVFGTDQAPITAGNVRELGALLSMPLTSLEATVEEFNAHCRAGRFEPLQTDNLSTVGLAIPKSHWARPINTAPFYAFPVGVANVFTFGGLGVDSKARVLDLSGRPIPGLYAAGETIGLYYRTYPPATSALKAAVFGRIAGSDAARYAVKQASCI